MNTATVTSASDPNASNDSATASTAVAAQSDLGVTKTGPASVALGQNITYTINITNSGALAAANTFVSDPTPAGLTPVSVSGGGCSAFPCALGTINPGGNVAITAIYNVPFGYPSSSVSNTASVSTSSPESNTANNSATAVTPVSGAGRRRSEHPQGRSRAGGVERLHRLHASSSPTTDRTTAHNVVISDPTPANVVFVSNSGGCTTPYPCVDPVARGESRRSRSSAATASPPTAARSSTPSTVTSSASDPAPSNNWSSSTVTNRPGRHLSAGASPHRAARRRHRRLADHLLLEQRAGRDVRRLHHQRRIDADRQRPTPTRRRRASPTARTRGAFRPNGPSGCHGHEQRRRPSPFATLPARRSRASSASPRPARPTTSNGRRPRGRRCTSCRSRRMRRSRIRSSTSRRPARRSRSRRTSPCRPRSSTASARWAAATDDRSVLRRRADRHHSRSAARHAQHQHPRSRRQQDAGHVPDPRPRPAEHHHVVLRHRRQAVAQRHADQRNHAAGRDSTSPSPPIRAR